MKKYPTIDKIMKKLNEKSKEIDDKIDQLITGRDEGAHCDDNKDCKSNICKRDLFLRKRCVRELEDASKSALPNFVFNISDNLKLLANKSLDFAYETYQDIKDKNIVLVIPLNICNNNVTLIHIQHHIIFIMIILNIFQLDLM